MTNKFIALVSTLTVGLSAVASDKLSLRGDFRFRTENIKEEQVAPTENSDRTRQRIRARIKMDFKVNDTTDVFVRLATGNSTPAGSTTYNQDLTDYSSKKGIYLDLAYAQIKLSDQSLFEMGKMLNPLFTAGSQDLVFDSDLTPEGLAYKFKSSNADVPLFFEAVSFWLNERFSATGATDNTDVGMIGAQIGYVKNFDDKVLTLALSHHNFSNIKNSSAASAKGNSTLGGNYLYDYKLTLADIEFKFNGESGPWTLFAQQARNSDPVDYNFAGLVGLRFGEAKEPGQWSLAVDHREVEKDAVVGIMNDSNSGGGGTNLRSNRVTYNYVLQENANLTLTLISSQKEISSTTFSPDYQRIMLDFNYRF